MSVGRGRGKAVKKRFRKNPLLYGTEERVNKAGAK
jgi:hypothetical protein